MTIEAAAANGENVAVADGSICAAQLVKGVLLPFPVTALGVSDCEDSDPGDCGDMRIRAGR